jgi:hypothetical protein
MGEAGAAFAVSEVMVLHYYYHQLLVMPLNFVNLFITSTTLTLLKLTTELLEKERTSWSSVYGFKL